MKIKALIPIAAAAAGLAGAALRGVSLITGYEAFTSLPLPDSAAQRGLIFLSVVAVAVLFAMSRVYKPQRGVPFERMFGGGGNAFKMISVLAGGVMIAASAYGLFLVLTNPGMEKPSAMLPMIPLWILAILTGGCFVGLAAALSGREITETTAAFTIVPMFWSCFDLIITFKDNGASPFVGLYAFELFAAIALTYAFYALAGFLYGPCSPSRFAFSAGAAVFFCLVCVGGEAVNLLGGGQAVTPSTQTLLRYVCFLTSSVWLLALLARQSAAKAAAETPS